MPYPTPLVRAAATLAAGVLVAAGLSACGGGRSPSSGSSGPIDVKIVTLSGSFVSLPLAVADVEGYFTQNGLKPTFIGTTAGTTASAALVSGSADMGLLASAEGLAAAAKGQHLQWFAGLTTSYMGDLVVSTATDIPHRASGFPAAVSDLKGKKIGVTAIGASSYYALLSLLNAAGVKKDDVTIIGAGGNPAEVAGLQNHQLDAAILTDPLTFQVNQQGIATTIASFYKGNRPDLFQGNFLNGFAATSSYIESNPDAVHKAAVAVRQAQDKLASLNSAGDAMDLANKLHSQFSGVSVEDLASLIVADKSVWTMGITQQAMAHAEQLAQESGAITQGIPYESVVHPLARV